MKSMNVNRDRTLWRVDLYGCFYSRGAVHLKYTFFIFKNFLSNFNFTSAIKKMNPETYCGASGEHVHFNNQVLLSGEPVKLFGIDGIDKNTDWLDLKNCSGVLDEDTFSLLPNMEYINMTKCNFQQCSKVFAPLEKLASVHIEKSTLPFTAEIFELSINIRSLSLHNIEISTSSCFKHLTNLESLSLDSCIFQILNKDVLTGLSSLKSLSIANCQIQVVDSTVFDELEHLEGLDIRNTEIDEMNFDIFSKLKNLKFLSFHDNTIKGEVNYVVFEQLQSLGTIHFELNVYKNINFDSFVNLKHVKIGYTDDEENPEVDELIENLNSKNIKTGFVFCGTIEYDSDEMQECC